MSDATEESNSTKYYGYQELAWQLNQLALEYVKARELKHPDLWEGMGWINCEIGEVYEALLYLRGGWIRNNPENHPPKTMDDVAEELGDVIFMAMFTGLANGLNPLHAMIRKMYAKADMG